MTDKKKWVKMGVGDGTIILKKYNTAYMYRIGEQGEMDVLMEDGMEEKLGKVIIDGKKWKNMVANEKGEIKLCYSFWRQATREETEEKKKTCLTGVSYIEFLMSAAGRKVQLWQMSGEDRYFVFGIDAEYLASLLEVSVTYDEHGTTFLMVEKADTVLMRRIAVVLGEKGYEINKINAAQIAAAKAKAELRRRKIDEDMARLKVREEKEKARQDGKEEETKKKK